MLGKNGQLGWELHRTLAPLGEVTALDYPEIDLSNKPGCAVGPGNPAGGDYQCHRLYRGRPGRERSRAGYDDQRLAPGKLAQKPRHRAVLIHYSTDYVFDGKKGSAYLESDHPTR